MYLSLYRHHGAPPQTCLRSCVADGTPHLRHLRQHNRVPSTQLRHVVSFVHRLPTETHRKAVFRQPHCRRHLPTQHRRCVILTQLHRILHSVPPLDCQIHIFVTKAFSLLCWRDEVEKVVHRRTQAPSKNWYVKCKHLCTQTQDLRFCVDFISQPNNNDKA